MQPDSGSGKPQETTILCQSETLLAQISDLQTRVDNRFNRAPEPKLEEEVKVTVPNVLDEITSNLSNASKKIDKLIGFISTEVLLKIN